MRMSIDEILALDKYKRTALLNQISGIRSAHLLGSQSKLGQSNLALFNSVIHIGANPPLLGFIMRPTTVERHSYHNIKETGYFTLNQFPAQLYKQAHQTSAKYPLNISEFEACGFQEEWINDFPAPFVKECSIQIGLAFEEEQLIKANNTRLVIGRIQALTIADSVIDCNGYINFEQLNLVGVSGLNSYYSFQKLGDCPYAKP
jgi:flavin reductase (DIM6/NTAB) family NADH-FMN oxidoreductase RutF